MTQNEQNACDDGDANNDESAEDNDESAEDNDGCLDTFLAICVFWASLVRACDG